MRGPLYIESCYRERCQEGFSSVVKQLSGFFGLEYYPHSEHTIIHSHTPMYNVSYNGAQKGELCTLHTYDGRNIYILNLVALVFAAH